MAYQRMSWLFSGSNGGTLAPDAEASSPTPAADISGEGGYPALFTVGDGIGFFATGPGQGLIYFFDRRRDIAFLFPNPLE